MPSPRTQQALARLADLTPRQIVAELDRYIVGQNDAKKAGNIAEWLQRFGGHYQHMIVLDADSLMTGDTLVRLVAAMERNPGVGLIQNACPHRGASLFFGRNEEEGLRCVYHGWKFDVTGACVDMPSEPAESNFKSKVKILAYPTTERNGIIWAYMGPREVPPRMKMQGMPVRSFMRIGPDRLRRACYRCRRTIASTIAGAAPR